MKTIIPPIELVLAKLMSRPELPGRTLLLPEQRLCIEFAEHLRRYAGQGKLRCVWTHVPNEGKRSHIVGAILRRMGMIPGTPDYVFCWEKGCGFIEFKTAKGKASPYQLLFARWCQEIRVEYHICRSVDEGIEVLKTWNLL